MNEPHGRFSALLIEGCKGSFQDGENCGYDLSSINEWSLVTAESILVRDDIIDQDG